MSAVSILIVVVVMLGFGLIWFLLSYLLGGSSLVGADGHARVTGNCGDTMELSFKMEGDRVARTHFWTDGCATSRTCIEAAALLAYGKTAAELKAISMMDIIDHIGSLPDSHLHCAQLAETTLHQAVREYYKNPAATGVHA
jgi:nitrogen fixation NifU-like protein